MTLRRAALVLCALCALATGGREEDGITAAVGVTIVERALGTWRVVGDGSSEFPCHWGGPGVMRSLLGTCVFGPDVR